MTSEMVRIHICVFDFCVTYHILYIKKKLFYKILLYVFCIFVKKLFCQLLMTCLIRNFDFYLTIFSIVNDIFLNAMVIIVTFFIDHVCNILLLDKGLLFSMQDKSKKIIHQATSQQVGYLQVSCRQFFYRLNDHYYVFMQTTGTDNYKYALDTMERPTKNIKPDQR